MKPAVPGDLALRVPARMRVGSRVMVVDHGADDWEPRGSAAVVLAWVALEGHADRRRLSATLWPESDVRQARSNLRVLVHRINHRFGSELLVGTEQLELDASRLHVELHNCEAILAAIDAGGAARCELLAEAGLEADQSVELRAWLAGARQRLKRLQLTELSEALTHALALDSHERAAVLARACLQLDPLSEHRYRQLMEVLIRGGDRTAALSVYEDCKEVLRQRLGVLPDRQTRNVQLRILQDQALGPAQGEPKSLGTDGLTRLGGAARYPLVEREAVLGQAQAALEQGVHVVVQGEPGVGKTRLMHHLAARAGGECELVAIRFALKHEPYAAVAQLLQEVQPRRTPCVDVPEQIELARLAPLAFATVKPSEAALSATRLHAALRQWLLRLRDAGVHLLVLDDLQYADAASQAAFASLLEAPTDLTKGVPALLLGHRSGDIDAVLDDAVTEAQAHHRANRIDLQRLSPTGVLALLRTMDLAQSARDPKALAAQLHQRTGGNPLFVIELAQQTLAQGEAADTSKLQALLGFNLNACSQIAQQLAAVAAVAADDLTVELAAAVTGQTPLGLMPAWRELQRRGLFAGHGLAHDLVQEAVLSGLPQAILQLLHRQVAQVLEGQGVHGAAVLRHWMAAEDADLALPHAVSKLHALSAAGLPTRPHELELLGLLERAGDPTLAAHLWLTAELGNGMGAPLPAETWQRLRALRLRVQGWPEHAAHAAWIAFETARDLWLLGVSAKAAYDVLAPAAEGMPQHGVERALVERMLALLAAGLTGDARTHLRQAQLALSGLPEQPGVVRVRMEIEDGASMFLDPAEGIRTLAVRLRACRKRGDLAMVAKLSERMGFIQAVQGNATHALRHYSRVAHLQVNNVQWAQRFQNPFLVGKIALNAGHFALCEQLLLSDRGRSELEQPVPLALLYLRLGMLRQVQMQLARVIPASLLHFPAQTIYAHCRAQLDRFEGRDPVPALRQLLDLAVQQGLIGLNRELMAWEIDLQTQTLAQRLRRAGKLLGELRRSGPSGARQVKTLLEIAEVHAEAGDSQTQSLAAEAARLLRRGCANTTLYLPEGLLRCARLMRPHDARQADALVHVAQRWLRQALQRLPPGAEEGFVRHVCVNRLLLGSDTQALYTAALH